MNRKALRIARMVADITQHEIAHQTGITQNRYWRIENGYQEPTAAERATFARILKSTPAELFPDLESREAPTS